MRQTLEKTHSDRDSSKYLANTHQNFQDDEKQGKNEKLSQT